MKKLLLVLFLLLVSVVCNSQILEKSASGKYRMSAEKWEASEITVKPEAQKYDSCFAKAISNPNKKILVERSEKFLKLKLLFLKKVNVEKSFIIYDNKTKSINYIKAAPVIEQETSYLILSFVFLLFLMIRSNILFKKRSKNKDDCKSNSPVAFLSTFTVVWTYILACFLAFAALCFNYFSLFFAIFAVCYFLIAILRRNDDIKYRSYSLSFYISIIISIVLAFV